MASFIELHDGNRRIGKFDLPQEVTGSGGGVFRLVRSVKGGGNGIVFEARPVRGLKDAPTRVAVKLLRQQDDSRMDRFANEIRILKTFNHGRIARFFDSGQVDLGSGFRVPWVAMDLGDANLREHVQSKGPLPSRQLASVGIQICEALEHVHSKQIIHRDIKPDNFVWYGADIRMIDFGIAKLFGEDVSGRPLDQFTQHLEFVGPVFFSSPELIAYAGNKKHPVDQRSDLFQLGKVLWFLATGTISAGIPSRRQCPMNGRLHDIVLGLLNDDPNDRPGSATTVRDQLGQVGV
jgi:serine/threonine protein kinase